ncbi:MAG: UPF0149 family protein [Francisellaceae bacterium]
MTISNEKKWPSYDEVSEALLRISGLSEAAEAHGLLCALFTAGANIRVDAWIDSLMEGQLEAGDIMVTGALKTLSDMYQYTKSQFNESLMTLDLLLPSDDDPFYRRIDALAMWCQGYLSGLGLMEIDLSAGSEEVKEAINDLLDISRLQYDEEETGDESDEKAYAELVEYAKVAALLIYSEFAMKAPDNERVDGRG